MSNENQTKMWDTRRTDIDPSTVTLAQRAECPLCPEYEPNERNEFCPLHDFSPLASFPVQLPDPPAWLVEPVTGGDGFRVYSRSEASQYAHSSRHRVTPIYTEYKPIVPRQTVESMGDWLR